MGYINEFRGKLTTLLTEGKTEDAVKYACDSVLESYHNGQEASGKAESRSGEQPRPFVKRGSPPRERQGARKNAPR